MHLYPAALLPGSSSVKLWSRSVVSDSLWPPGLYSPWNSPGQNTGVGSCSLLQGIFPTQGSNPGPPHCRWILYHLSHQELCKKKKKKKKLGSNPGLVRSPGGRHGNPLQYSWLENPMKRGAWLATVHWVTKTWTQLKWQHTCKEIVSDVHHRVVCNVKKLEMA